VISGGFGSAVRELLDREGRFDLRFKRIGLPVETYSHGDVEIIKNKYLLDEEGIFRQILEFYKNSPQKK